MTNIKSGLNLLLLCSWITAFSQTCEVQNKAFDFGEKVDYTIYYHLAGIWVGAGEVYFKVDSTTIGDKPFYHFNSYGTTFSKYDWIYKVRDRYQTYCDVNTFKPLRFKREVNEGSTFIREDYLFNHKKNEFEKYLAPSVK